VLQRPQSGMVDTAGRVLVTDVSRNAVFVFDEAAGKLDVWDHATRTTRFAAPIGIAAGPAGQVLVTDADLGRVFRLGPDGAPLGEFGIDVLQRPTGIARDAKSGRTYVADTHAHDVKVFDDEGLLLATWGRRGSEPGELNYPTHLAIADGMLLVSDSMNARVQGFDAEGKPVLRFGERGLYVGNLVRPKGVAADDEGNLYVVESMHDTLLVFDREARLLMSLTGSDNEAGHFYLPAGIWVDRRNRVFVADMFNGRVAVFQFLGGN
jgi:DNA-binding beta-propeller fold protein YncE